MVASGNDADTLLVTYEYDGRHQRIVKIVDPDGADTDYDFYYNLNWQVVEEGKGVRNLLLRLTGIEKGS